VEQGKGGEGEDGEDGRSQGRMNITRGRSWTPVLEGLNKRRGLGG